MAHLFKGFKLLKAGLKKQAALLVKRFMTLHVQDGLDVDPITNRCPDNGARVNINDCSISSNVGATELKSPMD